jgi:hypothetical protein
MDAQILELNCTLKNFQVTEKGPFSPSRPVLARSVRTSRVWLSSAGAISIRIKELATVCKVAEDDHKLILVGTFNHDGSTCNVPSPPKSAYEFGEGLPEWF